MKVIYIFAITISGVLALLLIRSFYLCLRFRWPPRPLTSFLHQWQLSCFVTRRTWLRRISWGEASLQLLYWSSTLICTRVAVKSSEDAQARAGSLAVLQLSFLWIGSRLHLISDMLGTPLGVLTTMHQTAGWMAFLQTGLHIVFVSQNTQIQWRKVGHREGIIASCTLAVMLLILLPSFRRHMYEIFIKLHYCLALCSLVFLWLHILRVTTATVTQPTFSLVCLEVATGLLIITTVVQLGRVVYFNLPLERPPTIVAVYHMNERMESEEQMGSDPSTESKPEPPIKIRVELPRGWALRPGQTVYLYVRTMNPWSITQGHPFSVVWWHEELRLPTDPSNDEELGREFSILGRDGTATAESIMESMIERPFTFWLLIQPRWGLTKHLAAYGSSTKLRAVVDGPYGGNHDLKEYGHVIMFAQGIGIAAQIPYIRYLLYGSLRGELPVRRISLIWETHSCNLATVSPWMRHLLMEDFDNYTKTLMLNIKLYIPDVHNNEEYGRRVKSFAHRVNIKEVLPKEFQHDRGKILITASAGEGFMDSLRDGLLKVEKEGLVHQDFKLLCLDFQPAEATK